MAHEPIDRDDLNDPAPGARRQAMADATLAATWTVAAPDGRSATGAAIEDR
jgi:hypothetical protein